MMREGRALDDLDVELKLTLDSLIVDKGRCGLVELRGWRLPVGRRSFSPFLGMATTPGGHAIARTDIGTIIETPGNSTAE
jgi:hypothetical protein